MQTTWCVILHFPPVRWHILVRTFGKTRLLNVKWPLLPPTVTARERVCPLAFSLSGPCWAPATSSFSIHMYTSKSVHTLLPLMAPWWPPYRTSINVVCVMFSSPLGLFSQHFTGLMWFLLALNKLAQFVPVEIMWLASSFGEVCHWAPCGFLHLVSLFFLFLFY